MKKRLYIIILLLLGLCHTMCAQRYQLDVELRDGSIVSYPMMRVQDVRYENRYTIIYFHGKNSNTMRCYRNDEVRSLSWSEYKGLRTPDGTKEFHLDEQRRSVVTPQYSVAFDVPCIEGNKTLTVRETSVPPLFGEGVGRTVAYDFNLEGLHKLDGIVEIRLPLTVGYDKVPMAAYLNEETGEWDPVNYVYDRSTNELVIKTSHLSEYAAFEVDKANTRAAKVKFKYVPDPEMPIDAVADMVARMCYSDNLAADLFDTYCDDAGTAMQIGIDITYQGMKALGLDRPNLDELAGVMGNLGLIMSVYQIIRADFHRDDVQVAGNTLKLCLNQVLGWASEFCGNAILTGSMASMAFLDYALTKFANEAWEGRKDIYKAAYEMYYSPGEDGYRSVREWFDIMWPIFQRKDLTDAQLHALVDKQVQDYVWKFWDDETTVAYYMNQAKGLGWSGGGGLNQSIKNELSNGFANDLYNGYLTSVFAAIKHKLEDKIWENTNAQMEKYAKQVNKIVQLSFRDTGLDPMTGKSDYANCYVRFKELPDTIKNPETWQVRLNERGEGKLVYRLFALYDLKIKPQLEVVNAENDVLLSIELSNVKAGYTYDTGNNDIDLNDYDPSGLDETDVFEVKYVPDFQHVEFKMGGYYSWDSETFQQNNEPDPRDGIYFKDWSDGIEEVMKIHKYVQPDAQGNIEVNDMGLRMQGTFDKSRKCGSGTFKIDKTFQKTVLEMEQVKTIFSSKEKYYEYSADCFKQTGADGNGSGYMILMNGEMQNVVEGTFEVEQIGGKYYYHFTGKGTYKLLATAFNEVVNIKCLPVAEYLKYPGDLEVHTTSVEVSGDIDLIYYFVVKP